MQIVDRPRKEGPSKNVMLLSQGGSFEECDVLSQEGPSKNVMLLSHEGGSFEECDAAKQRKKVMQLAQVLNVQNKVHIKRESVLQLNC